MAHRRSQLNPISAIAVYPADSTVCFRAKIFVVNTDEQDVQSDTSDNATAGSTGCLPRLQRIVSALSTPSTPISTERMFVYTLHILYHRWYDHTDYTDTVYLAVVGDY